MSDLVQLFGVMIPLAPFLLVAFIVWMRHQRRMAESTATLSAEKAAQYATNYRELEQRVRVLERIVTDKGYDVAAQIEALRDTRRMETHDESR